MRIASCVVSVTIVFALAGPVLAGDTSRVHPKTPPTAKGSSRPELLTLSGMQQQIRQLPRHVLARFDHAAKQATGTKQAVVRRLITQSLDSERIEHRVSAQLSRDLQKEHSTKVLEWLRSDLGRTIARFEEQAWAPQAATERETFAATLAEAPTTQPRLHLIRRLDHATGITETLLEAAEFSAFGAAMAIDSGRPPGERVGEDRIRVQIDQERQVNREQWQKAATNTLLFAYRSLSDADLERYVEFLESDAGREYSLVTAAALKDVFYESAEAMSHRVTALLQGSKD